jgi:hypothetical protein
MVTGFFFFNIIKTKISSNQYLKKLIIISCTYYNDLSSLQKNYTIDL